jgi:hypothetical protein
MIYGFPFKLKAAGCWARVVLQRVRGNNEANLLCAGPMIR